MQKEYLYLGDKSVTNDRYLLAVFKIIPEKGLTLEDAASEIAAESSTGSNLHVGSATHFSLELNARVYKIDEKNNLVYIAYPWEIFDSDGNVQNILTFIVGNVMGMSEVKACRLLDVYFPPAMLVHYDGPRYTIDDMRNYLQIFDSPILGTIIKPKIGLTPNEYAELCYDFWVGGGMFVKNDEPQANQHFSPFTQMVDSVRWAMDKAENETGHAKVHSFNISAADYDTMIRRAEYIISKMKPGSFAFLVDGITAGWTAVQTIRKRYPDVFLHFHRAGHGAFTREESPFGMTVPVMTMFARLAGASGIHTGTAGIGKMAGTADIDILAARSALKIYQEGPFFEQTWSKIPVQDKDLVAAIDREKGQWNMPIRKFVQERSQVVHIDTDDHDWRIVRKMAPIISGGLNPVLLPEFLEVMGTIDFITTMGGGIHSHPMGTQSGAKAVVQAYEAWKNNVTLEDYAKDHQELKVAIDFYNKNGTQAHRLKGNEQV